MIIDKVAGFLTNPNVVNVAQNTKYSVSVEALFKSTGRPLFMMMDKNADLPTRQYSATKEALYQTLCLGIYLTLVPILFQKYGFKFAQKVLKNEHCIPAFKSASEYLKYLKLAALPKDERQAHKYLATFSDTLKETADSATTLKQNLLTQNNPNKYKTAKGAIEFSNLAGTVIGLAIIASELSNMMLHPIMRKLGFEKASKNTEQHIDKKI